MTERNLHVNKEVSEFLDKASALIYAMQETPGVRECEYGVYTKVKFKPVFYVRPDVIRMFENATLLYAQPHHIRMTFSQRAPKLFGIDVRINENEGIPMISLALEPTDPYFMREDAIPPCQPPEIEEIIAAVHDELVAHRREIGQSQSVID